MRNLALAFSCFLTALLSAQSEYRLFQPGEQYLYVDESFAYSAQVYRTQFYGVRIDSMGCQDLYASLDYERRRPDPCIRRVPSPFGYSICQAADSTVLNFRELGRMVLYQRALPGTTWVALDNGSIRVRGTVLSVKHDQVLGAADSIKVIALIGAAGDTLSRVRISQHHGVAESPFLYDLSGNSPVLSIAGTTKEKLGLQLPEDSSYGSVAVGNEYHIESIAPKRTLSADNFDLYDQHQQETRSVRSVDSILNGVTYFTTVGDLLQFNTRSDGSEPARDSVLYRDTVRQWSYRYPDELKNVQPGARILIDSTLAESMYRVRSLFLGPCGLLSTRQTFDTYFFGADSLCGEYDQIVDGGPYDLINTPWIPFPIDTTNFGMAPVHRHLRYMNIDLLECGTAYDFSDITVAVVDPHSAFSRQLKLYPNPARAGFTVEIPTGKGSCHLQLFTRTGAMVGSAIELTESTYVPIEGLPSGVYTVVIKGREGAVARRRLVVQ